MPDMQDAQLTNQAGTVISLVKVPAFPENPDLVECDGRYFDNGTIGYGVSYLTYTECEAPYKASCLKAP